MRIHFATFDAVDKGFGPDRGVYNATNCNLAANVLNANVRVLNEGKQPAKFWCEQGAFHA